MAGRAGSTTVTARPRGEGPRPHACGLGRLGPPAPASLRTPAPAPGRAGTAPARAGLVDRWTARSPGATHHGPPILPQASPPLVLVVEDDAETCRSSAARWRRSSRSPPSGPRRPAIAQGAALWPDLVVAGARPRSGSAWNRPCAPSPSSSSPIRPTPAPAARAPPPRRPGLRAPPLCPAELRVRAANLVATSAPATCSAAISISIPSPTISRPWPAPPASAAGSSASALEAALQARDAPTAGAAPRPPTSARSATSLATPLAVPARGAGAAPGRAPRRPLCRPRPGTRPAGPISVPSSRRWSGSRSWGRQSSITRGRPRGVSWRTSSPRPACPDRTPAGGRGPAALCINPVNPVAPWL